ncbi:MAG: oligopeptide:H+ symporter [Cyanobacteriota bacterium]
MSSKAGAFNHPKPFYLIWFIELWERFGFYGMQAILVLYLVKELGFNDDQAYNTFGAFAAILYALTILGGYVGDNVLGTKRTIVVGAITLFLGYLMLSIGNQHTIYHGLGVICVGNGLFKANPSSLLSKLYEPNDPRIDGAFTLYYMSINIGSFVSIAATPFVAHHYGWNIAFSVSAIGLMLGIINYLCLMHWAKDVGSAPDFKPLEKIKLLYIIFGSILVAVISSWLLQNLNMAHSLLALTAIVVIIIYIKEVLVLKGQDRANLIACLILIIQAIFFFTLYQQMPTSINFFTVRNVTTTIFGFQIAPASFQALNPLWIIIASPILAHIYHSLAKKDKDFSMPAKFAFGMFLCSFGFLILYLSSHFATSQGMVAPYWLVISYGFQSVGELLVSGLGCAMVARLCPQRLMGFMMGVWFMSTAAAMVLGGYVAAIASVPENINEPLLSLPIYTDLFLKIGVVTLIIAIIMILFVPLLKKMCLKESILST